MMAMAWLPVASSLGQNPSALWADYVNARTNGTEPELPDFSYAGYHNGEDPIPTTFAYKVFDVTDYGAIPNDNVSDKNAFMQAIQAAEANGEGVVYFPAGDFLINESTDDINQIITINKSKIVIRGAGSGSGGTKLIQNSYTEPSNPSQMWTSPFLIQFVPASKSTSKISDVTANATRETFSVQLANASNVSVGQWVRLVLSDNDPDLVEEEFAPYDIDALYTGINTKVELKEVHQVAAVSGNTVTFKEPIHRTINSQYNWYLETFPRLEEVGVMDLSYQGGLNVTFVHHRSWQDDSGWSGIQFNQVVNGWIYNVEYSNMSQAGQFKLSGYCSGLNNKYVGNPGHDFVTSNASTGTVIGLNADYTTGVWHGCGLAAAAIGNVIWKNYQPTSSGVEIHSSQPRANCLDGVVGGFGFNMGGAVGSLPNHLRHLVVWNVDATGAQVEKDPYYVYWEPGTGAGHKLVMPIVSGLKGFESMPGQTQVNESPGEHVDEASLYEHQLTHRLGTLPSWIKSSSNSLLSIKVDGTALANFDKRLMRYPIVASAIPAVSVVPEVAEATVDIQYPSSLPGSIEIKVTSTAGIDRIYMLDLELFSYTETLDKIPTEGWQETTYTGDNDIKWTVDGRVIDGYLDGFSRSVYFNSGETGLTSETLSGGIRSFSARCLNKWDDGSVRKLELLVNGKVVGTQIHEDDAKYDFVVEDIFIEGDVVIAIRNASATSSNNAVAIDDISWVPMEGDFASGNNYLSDIQVDGKSLEVFFRQVTEYLVPVSGVPVVTVVTEDTKAVVDIKQAASLSDKAIITVTAENGTKRIYELSLFFREALSANDAKREMTIYPNPVAVGQELYLQTSGKSADQPLAILTTLSGEQMALVVTRSPKGYVLTLPDTLRSGMYFLTVSEGQSRRVTKLLVQ